MNDLHLLTLLFFMGIAWCLSLTTISQFLANRKNSNTLFLLFIFALGNLFLLALKLYMT